MRTTPALTEQDDPRSFLADQGFRDPDAWLDFARTHGFRRVPALHLSRCPDCGRRDGERIGEYVYYSHLATLTECRCGLVWSDLRLDRGVVARHFERVYKGDAYFARRERIFRQIADLVRRLAPTGGSVIDVGGAEGHLMHGLAGSGLRLTVSDVSWAACQTARRKFGLRAAHAGIAELATTGERADVLVLSDVLYYEPDIRAAWRLIERLPAGGSAIIRVPNRLARIRAHASREASPSRPTLPHFNPEHLYVLSRGYLTRRLAGLGFTVSVLPSHILGGGLRSAALYAVASGLHALSGAVATPALLVVARRP